MTVLGVAAPDHFSASHRILIGLANVLPSYNVAGSIFSPPLQNSLDENHVLVRRPLSRWQKRSCSTSGRAGWPSGSA
jgi:hypothetical protein